MGILNIKDVDKLIKELMAEGMTQKQAEESVVIMRRAEAEQKILLGIIKPEDERRTKKTKRK